MRQAGKMFFPLILTLALLTSCPCAGECAPASGAARFMDERALDLGLQTELPSGDEEMKAEDSGFWDLRFPGTSRRAASFLLYFALALIIVILAVHLKLSPWSASRSRDLAPKRDGGASGAPGARSERMGHAAAMADDMAAAGDFAGAMHLILIESVGELRRRLAVPIAASLTSREILERAPLSGEERAALARIVSGVEISYFGTYQPGAAEYAACRGSFESLRNLFMKGGAS